jgi:uncharacterized protein
MRQSRYNIWVERDGSSYVYNGVSGALLRMSADDRSAVEKVLKDRGARDCSPELLKKMAVGRMLVPDDADEIELLTKRYAMSRYDSSHFALTIVTSLGCNFDCPYCFEAKHPSLLHQDVVLAILGVLDLQLPRINSFDVTWFGGEPLVGRRPLLALSDQFIERCDMAGVEYSASITTNGYLLNEKTCQQLRDRRVGNVQVCLDGPPEVHDRMRPLQKGGPTFWRIVHNLRHAVNYFPISVRMNVDTENMPLAEKLLQILYDEGLSGKLHVYPGQIVGVNDGAPSPSAEYRPRCFTNAEFALAELEFGKLCTKYGFGSPTLPRPSGAPCTAVRKNEIVVGSAGELYKCWDSVGNKSHVTGSIFDYANPNGRLRRWLEYDPFTDEECRSCIALPVCMGGCAHHSMDVLQHENRCSTFRHTYREQVTSFVEHAEQERMLPISVADDGLARRMDTR